MYVNTIHTSRQRYNVDKAETRNRGLRASMIQLLVLHSYQYGGGVSGC